MLRLGVILAPGNAWHRALTAGLRRHAPNGWETVFIPLWERDAPRLAAWGLGAVAFSNDDPGVARAVRGLGLPTVNLGQYRGGFPQVLADDRRIGAAGAELLAAAGCRALAYAPVPRQVWSWPRRAGLLARARSLGLAWAGDAPQGADRRRAWLARLPPRTGILAGNDLVACTLLGACREAGRPVPEVLAVAGVDDDPLLAALADPPLSSIPLPAEAVAEAAIALLQRLQSGAAPPPRPLLLPPPPAVQRASTAGGGTDPLARARAWLEERLAEPLRIPALAAACGLPRRTLERRFRRALGRTPGAELRRLRLARACELLPGQGVAATARAVGYPTVQRFIAAFRAAHGATPGRWRAGLSRGG